MNVQHGSIEKKRKEKGILELSFGRATAGWPSRQLRETAIPALFRRSLRTFRCMLSFRLQHHDSRHPCPLGGEVQSGNWEDQNGHRVGQIAPAGIPCEV
jgi:hypothetical protein